MTTLDLELLDEFDAALRQAAPAVLHELGSGIDEGTLADIDARFGGKIPEDLKAWWRRHGDGPAGITPGYGILGAEQTVERYEKNRAFAHEFATDSYTGDSMRDADLWWPPTWLPLLRSDGWTSIDLVIPGLPAPLRFFDWEEAHEDSHGHVIAPSLGDFLEELLGGYSDDGYETADGRRFVYDATTRAWRGTD